jgi:hypothetical protein
MFDILVDVFGAAGPYGETWEAEGQDFSASYLWAYGSVAFSAYQDTTSQNGDLGRYRFPVALNNGSAQAADETFENVAGASGEDIKIHFTLTHTPK